MSKAVPLVWIQVFTISLPFEGVGVLVLETHYLGNFSSNVGRGRAPYGVEDKLNAQTHITHMTKQPTVCEVQRSVKPAAYLKKQDLN